MSLIKVAEIADILQVKPQSINKWKERGKIIIENGYFDYLNPINAKFLRLRELKKQPLKNIKECKPVTLGESLKNGVDVNLNPVKNEDIQSFKVLAQIEKLTSEEIKKYCTENEKQSCNVTLRISANLLDSLVKLSYLENKSVSHVIRTILQKNINDEILFHKENLAQLKIEVEKLNKNGLSLREIAKRLNCSHMKISRLLKE